MMRYRAKWVAAVLVALVWFSAIELGLQRRQACQAAGGQFDWSFRCERTPPGIIIQRDLRRS